MAKKCKKADCKEPKNPEYICAKCDRKAKKKNKLCKPVKINL